MANRHFSAKELAAMDRLLTEMRTQSRNFGGELLRARQVLRLLTNSRLELPRPLQQALNEYHAYMQRPPYEQPPSAN